MSFSLFRIFTSDAKGRMVQIFFAVALAGPFIFLNLHPGDDFVYRAALKDTDWLSYGINYYNTWGGRFFFGFAFPTLISEAGTPFLRLIYIVCAGIFAASTLGIVEFFAQKKLTYVHRAIFCVSFFCIHAYSISSATLWLTGAFNFFLPLTSALYILLVVLRGTQNNPGCIKVFFCIIFSIVAGSYEQTALFLCLNLFVILLCYPQSRNSWFVYTLMSLVGLCACITIFAPGNFLRYSVEMARWYPDFNKNAYFENSFNVIKLIFESIFILNIRLYIFICAVILFAVREGTALRKSAWQNVALGIAFLPTIVFGFGFMSGLSMHPNYEKEQNIGDSASFYLHMPEQYASIILSFIALACFLLLVYFVLRYKRSALAQICIFVIGCLTFYMLSFSPTMYASGYRTHFIMNVTLWLLAGFLVAHVKNIRHLRWLLALSILCASTQLIHVLGKFSRYFSM